MQNFWFAFTLRRDRSRGRFWAAIRLPHHPEPSGHAPWRGRWIWQWRTTWSTVCSSAPHSQAAEGVITLLSKQEGKPDQHCSWQGHSRMVGANVGDESTEYRTFSNHFAFHWRECLISVLVVRWTDELLCGGYKRVSHLRCGALHSMDTWALNGTDVQVPRHCILKTV